MNIIDHTQLVIGDWYCVTDRLAFEIVAIDESHHSLEVQFYDGTIGEFDISTALMSGQSVVLHQLIYREH